MAVLNICNIIFCSRVGLKNNHGAHRAKAVLMPLVSFDYSITLGTR